MPKLAATLRFLHQQGKEFIHTADSLMIDHNANFSVYLFLQNVFFSTEGHSAPPTPSGVPGICQVLHEFLLNDHRHQIHGCVGAASLVVRLPQALGTEGQRWSQQWLMHFLC